MRSRGWFVVQLYEMQTWGDYLDFPTTEEAIARAIETDWGEKARVRRGEQVVWQGIGHVHSTAVAKQELHR